MNKVILVIGIVIILWGIWIVVKPGVVKAILTRLKGPLIYVPALLRIALGVLFLVSVRDCKIKWIVMAFGIGFFAAGIGMFMIKPARLQAFFERWADRAPLTIRAMGIIAAACGGLIAYAA
ncbi:MAG: hypothetical protein DRP66_09020 [Planctomycetota bacterium]|nr:MAG: hypothetical protein DRP66_09020 [Planctomycetota bacterium]